MRWQEKPKAPQKMHRGFAAIDANIAYFNGWGLTTVHSYDSDAQEWHRLPDTPQPHPVHPSPAPQPGIASENPQASSEQIAGPQPIPPASLSWGHRTWSPGLPVSLPCQSVSNPRLQAVVPDSGADPGWEESPCGTGMGKYHRGTGMETFTVEWEWKLSPWNGNEKVYSGTPL